MAGAADSARGKTGLRQVTGAVARPACWKVSERLGRVSVVVSGFGVCCLDARTRTLSEATHVNNGWKRSATLTSQDPARETVCNGKGHEFEGKNLPQ